MSGIKTARFLYEVDAFWGDDGLAMSNEIKIAFVLRQCNICKSFQKSILERTSQRIIF